jgi:hypothetical protein
MEKRERHTITFIAGDVHFTTKELRSIPWEDFPKNAEVKFSHGHRIGDPWGMHGNNYASERDAQITIHLV